MSTNLTLVERLEVYQKGASKKGIGTLHYHKPFLTRHKTAINARPVQFLRSRLKDTTSWDFILLQVAMLYSIVSIVSEVCGLRS
ncbi:hypothetical protein CEXT_767741 [Caerostris extrusa]|uniref:Uncharacterized protein n=1 Tax=Caerostris extrusa TaxID=172846 RepID=A0AAV4TEW3_CAEEX|nr:hypothetical protein CEXT_767741 [Caerostris extrusa]